MNPPEKIWCSNYDDGVSADLEIPEISLVELFAQSLKAYRQDIFLIHNGLALTFQQVDQMSHHLATHLVKAGLKPGDRVGLCLGNTPAFVVSYIGILKAGGVVMALNPAYQPYEMQKQLAESGAGVLIIDSASYEMARALKAKTDLKSLILVNADGMHLSEADDSWEDLTSPDQVPNLSLDVEVSPDDPAVFQYSGGTTGVPKCAVGLHRNLVANVYQFSAWLVNCQPGEETILAAIPLYHVYGMVLGLNLAVKMGARLLLIDNPRDMDGLLTQAQQYRATIFPGVPNLYAAINHYPPVKAGRFDLSSIKACISGSATLPKKVKQDFEALTQGHLVEGYGLSEAPTATHCNPVLGKNKIGSIGLPLPGVDCKIVDLETGTQDVPCGETGEMILKGPQVMAGYYQRPEETALALRDGWLFTGDVARMDEEGYFYLIDRKKDVIKVGGFQVWPNEIESVLLMHPEIKEAAVAGIVGEDGQEMPKAWVVPHHQGVLTAAAVRDYCGQYLTGYKVPVMVEFRESLPKTGVGKILRRVLVEEHRSSAV